MPLQTLSMRLDALHSQIEEHLELDNTNYDQLIHLIHQYAIANFGDMKNTHHLELHLSREIRRNKVASIQGNMTNKTSLVLTIASGLGTIAGGVLGLGGTAWEGASKLATGLGTATGGFEKINDNYNGADRTGHQSDLEQTNKDAENGQQTKNEHAAAIQRLLQQRAKDEENAHQAKTRQV